MPDGFEKGLGLIDVLEKSGDLANYHLYYPSQLLLYSYPWTLDPGVF